MPWFPSVCKNVLLARLHDDRCGRRHCGPARQGCTAYRAALSNTHTRLYVIEYRACKGGDGSTMGWFRRGPCAVVCAMVQGCRGQAAGGEPAAVKGTAQVPNDSFYRTKHVRGKTSGMGELQSSLDEIRKIQLELRAARPSNIMRSAFTGGGGGGMSASGGPVGGYIEQTGKAMNQAMSQAMNGRMDGGGSSTTPPTNAALPSAQPANVRLQQPLQQPPEAWSAEPTPAWMDGSLQVSQEQTARAAADKIDNVPIIKGLLSARPGFAPMYASPTMMGIQETKNERLKIKHKKTEKIPGGADYVAESFFLSEVFEKDGPDSGNG